METKENKNNLNKQNTKNSLSNQNEKKIIIYLIITALILTYTSAFFIHNIIDRSQIKDVISGEIYPSDKNPTDNDENKNDDNNTQKPEVVDNSDRFKVKQGNTAFSEVKELDMFKNSYFNDQAIIAPGVQGTYSFTVENDSNSEFDYQVFFTETNLYDINMVYKIKLNGEYIIGDENKWVTHNNFIMPEKRVSSYKIDIYTVEWKWEDAENDTEVGETEGANYKMNVKVVANQVIE